MKTANVKQFLRPVFLMIAKDCTERLSAVALSVGLIIPRRFGSRGVSKFLIAWEDAVASEKNRKLLHGIVVYRRRVIQKVTSLRVASISRARPPENLKY